MQARKVGATCRADFPSDFHRPVPWPRQAHQSIEEEEQCSVVSSGSNGFHRGAASSRSRIVTRKGYQLADPAHGKHKHHAEHATYVQTLDEAAALISRGFSLRMGAKGKPASLIAPKKSPNCARGMCSWLEPAQGSFGRHADLLALSPTGIDTQGDY